MCSLWAFAAVLVEVQEVESKIRGLQLQGGARTVQPSHHEGVGVAPAQQHLFVGRGATPWDGEPLEGQQLVFGQRRLKSDPTLLAKARQHLSFMPFPRLFACEVAPEGAVTMPKRARRVDDPAAIVTQLMS